MGGGSVRDDADGVCLHPLHAHAGRVLARVVQTNPEAVDELPGSGGERVQDGAGGHAEVQQNRQVSNQTIELFFTLLAFFSAAPASQKQGILPLSVGICHRDLDRKIQMCCQHNKS